MVRHDNTARKRKKVAEMRAYFANKDALVKAAVRLGMRPCSAGFAGVMRLKEFIAQQEAALRIKNGEYGEGAALRKLLENE